jgi:hypothetical protein
MSIARMSPVGALPANLLTRDEARRIAANMAKLLGAQARPEANPLIHRRQA